MSKKHILKEQLGRIQSIMGISEGLLIESPVPVTKFLVKQLLKNASETGDEITMLLSRMFNLTDNQIDNVVNQINRVGVDNLSDDVLELLARSSIDNVDDFVRFLKAGKFLGSNFDELSSRIFTRFEGIDEITPQTRQAAIDIYKRTLDDLPYLDDATEIKQKLVRDFQSEFDSKFADKISTQSISSVDNLLDDLLEELDKHGSEVSDNIVNDTPGLPPELRQQAKRYWDTLWTKNERFAEMVKRRAQYAKNIELGKGADQKIIPGGAEYAGKTVEDIERIIRGATKDQQIILNNIMRSNWYTAMNPIIKYSLISVILSGGATISMSQTILNSIMGLFQLGDAGIQKLKKQWLDPKVSESEGIITVLTPNNVENWFKDTYPENYVDNENFKKSYSVSINTTKDMATIERTDGSKEWEVKIQNNKIQEIKN